MKLLLVCTSGGHFSTMQSLKKFWSCHDRVWVTDRQSDTEILKTNETVHWLPYQAPRNVLALIKGLYPAFRIVYQEQPHLVISTGASLAINFALAAKLLGRKFIYIESISRSQNLSISGKLVYLISDRFYVQWSNLTRRYHKALFRGYV